jgi:hypothetical protein
MLTSCLRVQIFIFRSDGAVRNETQCLWTESYMQTAIKTFREEGVSDMLQKSLNASFFPS